MDRQARVLRYVESWQVPTSHVEELKAFKQRTTFTPGVGLPGRIWVSGQPAWIANLAEDQNFPRVASATTAGLQTAMGFPILLEDEVLGVIECFSTQIQAPDDDLLQMMTAIGSQIGQFMERQRAEEALRESEARFQSFMNHSPASAWIVDRDGRILYLSPTYFRMFQFPQQDAIGKTISDIYPGEFAKQFLENNQRVFETKQVIETIETAPRPGGSIGEFLVYKFPITSGSEETLLGGVAVDITERRRAEEALARSQQELSDFVENATVGLHWVDADGTILWANQCELDLLGYSREEYIGHHVAEFHADQEAIDDILLRLCRNETLCGYEARLRHKDGSIRYVSINSNVFWKDGKFIHTRCFSQDITERKRAEEALREKQERLSIAQQAGRLGVFDLNLQTNENVWSPEIEALYGLKPGEFEGNYQGWIDRLHPDDREKAQREMNCAYQTGEYSEDFRVIWPDGSIHLLYTRAKVFFDAAGNPLRMLGVNVDISDRKQAEEALRASAERLS
ncbi:MAG TPA: hypothetical protein DEV81_24485, partial [Cyanobacteria bacterium UBA11049]|nr:hypothetical protein [Cyanobacteria bacterium UBA11049]